MPSIVKSSDRTLRVLEFFALVRRPATASEIKDTLGLPQSSTSLLLRSLVAQGYLEYLRPSRTFRPTVRVTMLGDWQREELFDPILSKQLDQLHEETKETIILGRLNLTSVHFIRVLRPTAEIQFYMREGSGRPLASSASGRALLSVLPEEQARKIVRRLNAEATDASKRVDEAALMKELQAIRLTGISETKFAFSGVRDAHVIAALIPRSRHADQLSVGIAGPRERVLPRREELIAALRTLIFGGETYPRRKSKELKA